MPARRRKRRQTQKEPKNIKSLIYGGISLLFLIVLSIVIMALVKGGSTVGPIHVAFGFLGLISGGVLLSLQIKQLKFTEFDVRVSLVSTAVTVLSLAAFIIIYIIGIVS